MRPLRSFAFLLVVLICLTGLLHVLPAHLNLPEISSILPCDLFETLKSAKKSETRVTCGQNDNSFSKIPSDLTDPGHADRLSSGSVLSLPDSQIVTRDNITCDHLHGLLDSLLFSKEQVRILYYGDSQIEGDRISSYIRYSLRQGHSGSGPGLFQPLMTVMYTKSVYIRSSSNWKRYNYLSYKNGEISHNDLGPFMSICRYMPEGSRSSEIENAWVRIVPSKFADSAAGHYERLRIFYKNDQDPVKIVVKGDNLLLYTDSLRTGSGVQEFDCPLFAKKNILVEFSGRTSPDIYGMSIESKKGIIVDNIPNRGSAGLEFTMVGKENLAEVFKALSPDFIFLQYGLNIVKNVRNEYSYYEKGLSRQLELLKDISPGARILVIGVSDMATSENDRVITYPNISQIIKAQISAAEESNVLFWNSWEAMGGKSSIFKWVGANPPLAKKDHVHFTSEGADTIASMILSDLFNDNTEDTVSLIVAETIHDGSVTDKHIMDENSATGERTLLKSLLCIIFRYNSDEPLIFTSPLFWIFFIIILAGYCIIYKKLFIRNIYLFLVSLFFYYKTGGLFLFLLIIVTVVDYFCGIMIFRSRTKAYRRFFVFLSIFSNLLILGYFKYTGFFIESLNRIMGTSYVVRDFLLAFSNKTLGTSFDASQILLPVGISFFTFQSLSYTIDVYRKKCKPVWNIADFGFYVSFFPQLVAGPIVRASEFVPQLYAGFNITRREFSHALFLIAKGLIKKIIISDFIAVNFIDRVFDLPALYSGFENLFAIYGYGLQIYCDFSGYTDIAIGLGLILGFRLPLNFNSPFKATGLSDFWRRWHISLSRWLRDYLYIPLGGNRRGKFRTVMNLMITMLLGGLWHGAALRFIAWGGLHGLGLVINKLWNYLFGNMAAGGKVSRAVSVFLTFNFVSFCWLFFRAEDMHSVMLMLRQITINFSPPSYIDLIPVYGTVFSLIAAGYLIHFIPERIKESYRGIFIKMPLTLQMAVIIIIALMIVQMRPLEIIPFIYFRF